MIIPTVRAQTLTSNIFFPGFVMKKNSINKNKYLPINEKVISKQNYFSSWASIVKTLLNGNN